MDKRKKTNSIYYLGMIFVVLIWGLFPVITKNLLQHYAPALHNATSSLVGLIGMLFVCGKKLRLLNWEYFKVAVPTGLFYSAACIAQRAGLAITTPVMYAFLENISCIFVPVLMLLFVRQRLTIAKIVAGLLCLLGVFFLCGGNFGSQVRFGPGEILCALAGIFYSVNIAGTAAFAKKLEAPLYLLVQFFIHCVLSFGYAFLFTEDMTFSFAPQHLIPVIAVVLISTVLGWLIRTVCLQHLDPSFVAVIMPFSAVVTGVLSVLVGTDTLSATLIFGAVFIFAAILISGLADAFPKHKTTENTKDAAH